jgi:hypothetical protein
MEMACRQVKVFYYTFLTCIFILYIYFHFTVAPSVIIVNYADSSGSICSVIILKTYMVYFQCQYSIHSGNEDNKHLTYHYIIIM